jgi:hypothetical protein
VKQHENFKSKNVDSYTEYNDKSDRNIVEYNDESDRSIHISGKDLNGGDHNEEIFINKKYVNNYHPFSVYIIKSNSIHRSKELKKDDVICSTGWFCFVSHTFIYVHIHTYSRFVISFGVSYFYLLYSKLSKFALLNGYRISI